MRGRLAAPKTSCCQRPPLLAACLCQEWLAPDPLLTTELRRALLGDDTTFTLIGCQLAHHLLNHCVEPLASCLATQLVDAYWAVLALASERSLVKTLLGLCCASHGQGLQCWWRVGLLCVTRRKQQMPGLLCRWMLCDLTHGLLLRGCSELDLGVVLIDGRLG